MLKETVKHVKHIPESVKCVKVGESVLDTPVNLRLNMV